MNINNIHISNIIQARRMDPIFFRYGISQLGQKYKLTTIGSCAIDIQSGIGAGKEDQASDINGIIQIRPTNIDKEGLLVYDKNVYVPIDANMPSLEKGDILFNNTNSQELVGKTAIFTENKPYRFSNHITRIRVNKNKILPEYLWLILNLYQRKSIFYSICTNWNNQSGVGNELLKSIKIPLPILEKQQEIVELYSHVQEAKLAKDKEAKSYLEGIDIYLMDILDIEPLQNHTFDKIIIKNISYIIGNRLDVSFYKERFEMMSCIYPNKKLSSVMEIDPAIKFSQDPNTEISFVPMECIDEKYGEIFDARTTVISKTKGYTKFEEGDLLWAKITPCMQNGKSAIAKNLKNGVGCGSTEYYVMRPKNSDVLIEYVYMILHHKGVLEAAQNSFGGSAGQQRVSRQYLNSIIIPLPPLEKQQEIVKNINKMKQHAKQLQEESTKLLKDAKREIEQTIIG
ncbi:MAG: restriction endonuclease subunit S [Odoribacter splanchnicus]